MKKDRLEKAIINRIDDILKKNSIINTNKIAIIDNNIQLSYKDLFSKMKILSTKIKVTIGERKSIGIILENSSHCVLVIYSISASNCVSVPMDYDVSRENLNYIVNDISMSAIITDEKISNSFEKSSLVKIDKLASNLVLLKINLLKWQQILRLQGC